MPPLADHDSRWQDARWRQTLRRNLLRWFDSHERDLPWRQTSDPYRVWISEIMLQQTQVATVIDYFHRFMERFATVDVLAAADEQEVLRYWEGLGYYRRARQIHAAAKRIVDAHDGTFPTAFDDVLALPGIGRYTAGAILSISQDQRLPIVEANTLRLYSRLVALRNPPTSSVGQRLLWELAESVLPRKGSGRFNQAAMELGSLVCTPRDPSCDDCPLASRCAARELGLQGTIPGKVKKIKYEDRREVAIVVAYRDMYLVRKCQPDERWAGLWDFPRCHVADAAHDPAEVALDHLKRDYGVTLPSAEPLVSLKHGVTKYRITLDVYVAKSRAKPKLKAASDAKLKSIDEIDDLPLSTTGRKILERITK